MVGRKPAISPSVVVEALLLFKERVIFINSEGEKSKYIILNCEYNSVIM